MGANGFDTIALGKTADEAFVNAVKDAQWEFGHGGYTGTIAEKHGIVEFMLPPRWTFDKWVKTLNEASMVWHTDNDTRSRNAVALLASRCGGQGQAEFLVSLMNDKWGPAIAVELGKTEARRHKDRTSRYTTVRRGDKVFGFCGLASS
jgi:hypothetical protein